MRPFLLGQLVAPAVLPPVFCGADPLVCGRRPRRPARAWQSAGTTVPAAGRGRPAQTRGSAPQFASVLTQAARRNGMRNLREDGWKKIRDGLTTVDEVMRVTQEF